MRQPSTNDIEVGNLPPRPLTYEGANAAGLQPPAYSWPSKLTKILPKMLTYIFWVVLGAALFLYITAIIVAIEFKIHAFLDPTSFAHWRPRSVLVGEFNNSTMIMHWHPLQPILRRYHTWNDCHDWPETEKCKQEICNLDFTADCHNATELWECKMCFSDEVRTRQANTSLEEHCCKAKKRAEILWISLFSIFGLGLLLALGGCVWKQSGETGRVRKREEEIRLQDRQLTAAGRSQVDGAKDTIRWAKPARRVPVLPISRSSRNLQDNNTVYPATLGPRHSRGSLYSHNTESAPSAMPVADRIVRDGLPAVLEPTD